MDAVQLHMDAFSVLQLEICPTDPNSSCAD